MRGAYPFMSSVATADGTITSGQAGVLHGVLLQGSASGTVTLHDGTSTAGRTLLTMGMNVVANSGYTSETGLNIAFDTGLFLDLTGIENVTVIWG